MSIGDNIKKIRERNGLTQKQLGEKCGMADSAIRRYELGKANPKIETVQKIANALGVDAGDLDDRTDLKIRFVEKELKKIQDEYIESLKNLPHDDNYNENSSKLFSKWSEQDELLRKRLNLLAPPVSTGEKIKQLRESHSLSLEELSQKINIPVPLLNRYEKNERTLSLNDLHLISHYYGIAPEDIDIGVENHFASYTTMQDFDYKQLLKLYENLNVSGQRKAVDFLTLLSKIPEYNI